MCIRDRNFPVADEVFNSASEALGFDIKDMVWNGDKDTLMITENTQPAILTMSVAALRVAERLGLTPDVVAGLSLGAVSYTHLDVYKRQTLH